MSADIVNKVYESSPITDSTKQISAPTSVPFDKLDLTGTLAKKALKEMHKHNKDFIEESALEIENYFDLEMVQIMFDHNLQFKEFVFIFEDFWNNAEPHGERLERNINEVQEAREHLILEFVAKLEEMQSETIKQVVTEYIVDLKKNKEPKNGGFPNTDKMINALIEVIKFKFDDQSSLNFDALSEQFAKKFGEEVSNKLDLDPESIEFLKNAREHREKKLWMNGDQAHNPHSFNQ